MRDQIKHFVNSDFAKSFPRFASRLVCASVFILVAFSSHVMANSDVNEAAYNFPYANDQLSVFGVLPDDDQKRAQPPLVVELYTSANCVFCPQADKLLKDLVEKTPIIGISCHIDYYDVADNPLSQKFCSDRQAAYAANLFSGGIYTPQMVINGTQSAIGYKYDHVLEAAKAARQNEVAKLDIIQSENQKDNDILIYVDVPKLGTDANESLKALLIKYDHKGEFVRPASAKPSPAFVNLATSRSEQMLEKDINRIEFTVKPAIHAHGAIVLIQDQTGKIFAAGQIDWPANGKLN